MIRGHRAKGIGTASSWDSCKSFSEEYGWVRKDSRTVQVFQEMPQTALLPAQVMLQCWCISRASIGTCTGTLGLPTSSLHHSMSFENVSCCIVTGPSGVRAIAGGAQPLRWHGWSHVYYAETGTQCVSKTKAAGSEERVFSDRVRACIRKWWIVINFFNCSLLAYFPLEVSSIPQVVIFLICLLALSNIISQCLYVWRGIWL